MIVGVHKVVCTCGGKMRRTGGCIWGDGLASETYYCYDCRKHVVVITPNREE